MKKIYYYLGGLLLIACLMQGCSNKKEVDDQSVANQNQVNDNKINEDTLADDNSDSDTIQLEISQLDDSEKDYGYIKCALGNGLIDSKLTPVGEDYEGIANLPMNVKNDKNAVLLCKDPVYDIVYYVNYGDDNFIYRLKNGKSELVVEIPARRLFCVKGELFFIVTGYGEYEFEGMSEGNILKYNPLTGEVSVVVDEVVDTMIVYDDGIRYRVIDSIEDQGDGISFLVTPSIFYYSFNNQQDAKIDKIGVSLYEWNDYLVTENIVFHGNSGKAEGIKLETIDGQNSIFLTDDWNLMNNGFCIAEDKLFYINNENELVIISISQDKREAFPLINEDTRDFTMIGNRVYYTSLNCMNLEDGSQSILVSDDELIIRELYTDGTKLYGICDYRNGIATIRHLIIEEQTELAREVVEDGIMYEFGKYSYRAVKIGEE